MQGDGHDPAARTQDRQDRQTAKGTAAGDLGADMPCDGWKDGGEADSAITPEASDLLAKVDAGAVPAYVTENLRRIARENGIAVDASTTPDVIIDELRRRVNRTDSP